MVYKYFYVKQDSGTNVYIGDYVNQLTNNKLPKVILLHCMKFVKIISGSALECFLGWFVPQIPFLNYLVSQLSYLKGHL